MIRKSLLVAFLALVLSLGFVLYSFRENNLISPWVGAGKVASNQWYPQVASASSTSAPQITAKAAYFVETQTGEVLYSKNEQEKLPVASLAKIMTAIVALENKQLSDQLDVSERAAQMEPDKMLLIAGEKLTLEELLDGIFLVSANDASEVLAEEVTGSRDGFIKLMNLKASQLGMENTQFINPSGLQEDGRIQYSTAYDTALMSRYAIRTFPFLLRITSQPQIFLPKTDDHQDYYLESGINLLTTYPGVVGFKTGFTPEAGLTLVTIAQKEGKEVLGVLLGSENRRLEAKELLDYSFGKLGVEIND